MNNFSNRAGHFVSTTLGYTAFVPSPLPPNPPVQIDEEMQALLSMADRKLGRLDGITQILPDPELFVAMYVKKEALLSSQIEGTQASFVDVININSPTKEKQSGIRDVVNYVNALYWGLDELQRLPLSLRLIRNIHEKLLSGVRGADKKPGTFRTTQNWIGPQGCTLNTATFVPPTVSDMEQALSDLEMYIYDERPIPALIKIALIHSQFETIHPFLDGNGRMGRLLITFWLCQQQILSQPLLYLSYYFKQNRGEYYSLLMDVRTKGAYEQWIKFFLRGVAVVSDEATLTAKNIIQLKEKYSLELLRHGRNTSNYQKLFDHLFSFPIVTRKGVSDFLSVSNPTAGSILDAFCEIGILTDMDPEMSRNKNYLFKEYLEILEPGTE